MRREETSVQNVAFNVIIVRSFRNPILSIISDHSSFSHDHRTKCKADLEIPFVVEMSVNERILFLFFPFGERKAKGKKQVQNIVYGTGRESLTCSLSTKGKLGTWGFIFSHLSRPLTNKKKIFHDWIRYTFRERIAPTRGEKRGVLEQEEEEHSS